VVERGIGQQRLGRVVLDGRPLEPEEQQLRVERSGLLTEARDERAAGRVGHVRREVEVRERERADEGGLDALELRDRLGEGRGVEPGDDAVVALAERGGVGLGLCDLLVDPGIVDAGEQVGEVPRDVLGSGQLGRRHGGRVDDQLSSSSGRVTGARHAKRSQT
jgi:hypothetical protein